MWTLTYIVYKEMKWVDFECEVVYTRTIFFGLEIGQDWYGTL